jgi:CBS-domain-containing membrane protein
VSDVGGVQQVVVWLYRAVGTAVAIAIMELLARGFGEPLIRVPFVTSIVLTLALPRSEGARPYAVIGGHLLSTLAGFAALWCLGVGATASAVAVGGAALLMLSTRAVHPPAGIDAFLVPLLGLPLGWAWNPILAGAILLAAFAKIWSLGEVPLERILSGES